jgi:hypothetical protein
MKITKTDVRRVFEKLQEAGVQISVEVQNNSYTVTGPSIATQYLEGARETYTFLVAFRLGIFYAKEKARLAEFYASEKEDQSETV